jgi:hypothetical protein
VVEVPEELVEAVVGRQEFVAVAEMVLAELARGIAHRFQDFGNGDVARLQADRRSRQTHLAEAGAQRALARDEGRAARRAALLGVVVGEYHAFAGDTVDIGRAVAHDTEAEGADVGLADIVAEHHQDVRLLAAGWRRRLRLGLLDATETDDSECQSGPSQQDAPTLRICLVAHGSFLLTTQRNPTWLVEVSTGSAWRAAGR